MPRNAHPDDGEAVSLKVVEDDLVREAAVGLEDAVTVIEVLVGLLVHRVEPQLAAREVAKREQILVRNVAMILMALDVMVDAVVHVGCAASCARWGTER